MNRWLTLFGVLLLAGLALFLFRGKETAVPLALPPAPGPVATPVAVAPLAPAPAPEAPPADMPAPAIDESPAAASMPERAIVQRVHGRIREFGNRFGGNPEGTNAEITKLLDGGNAKGVRFLDPEDLRLNDSGELLDPWGTPYFFHQLSAKQMEIRSAGPDRQMWTDDDPIVK